MLLERVFDQLCNDSKFVKWVQLFGTYEQTTNFSYLISVKTDLRDIQFVKVLTVLLPAG
jgi:hypothetical protein